MADLKISQLPAVITVDAKNNVLPLVSGGVTTKASPQEIVLAALTAGVQGATAAGVALVRIEQQGDGYALFVEDQTNPDATPFVVHGSGGVSVGNTIDAGAGNLFVLGNIGANIISALQEMTIARTGGGQVMQIRGSLGATNPVLTISTSDAAGGVFFNINTVDGVADSFISFTGLGGSTMWTMTSDGDFFPRQGTTTMKEGFSFVAAGAGAPTETPTNENAGITPLYYDEANNRMYAYNSGWQYTSMAPSYITTEAGTSRTLTAADNNKVIYCTSGSAVTITTASGLGANFNCTIIQGGAGKVTVSQGASTTLVSYSSLFSTMGQYAVISLVTPVADTFVAAGNLGV
jgi:hypothetical protein